MNIFCHILNKYLNEYLIYIKKKEEEKMSILTLSKSKDKCVAL